MTETSLSAAPIAHSADLPTRIGYAGAGLQVLGLFLPAVSAPIVGSQAWIAMGAGGKWLLLLGLVSLALVWRRRLTLLFVTGGLSVLIAWMNFFSFESQMSKARSSPFGALGASMVSLQFGFYLVLVATLITVAAAVLALMGRRTSGRRD